MLKIKNVIDGLTTKMREYTIIRKKEIDFHLFVTSQYLMSVFSLNSLKDVVEAQFPKLGIKSCYISLFDDIGKNQSPAKYSINILTYRDYQIETSKQDKLKFLTIDLIPGGVQKLSCENPAVVMNLSIGKNICGFAVYEQEGEENGILEIINIQLCNTLRNIFLFKILVRRNILSEEDDLLLRYLNSGF